jgi:transcriptional regulator with XRE-family HTH domain
VYGYLLFLGTYTIIGIAINSRGDKMNRIALKIKEARKKSGLTEKQLAKKCGFSVGYIIQIESGKKIINEKAADKILNALGEKAEMLEDTSARQEAVEDKKVTKPVDQKVNYSLQPNAQWASALAGVLHKYPIVDCYTNKVVAHKELPIINNKVEGHKPDRLMFVRASNNEMEALRIEMGDVVMVLVAHEVQNNSLYLLEVGGKRIIRRLRKENNKLRLSKGLEGESPHLIDLKTATIIGKCIKVEFEV